MSLAHGDEEIDHTIEAVGGAPGRRSRPRLRPRARFGGRRFVAPTSASSEPVFSPLADERFALGLETIYEGYLVHYGRSRLFTPPDADVALLLGDYLYAHGLVRIAELGEIEAIQALAELISRCAHLRAEGAPGDGEAWADDGGAPGVERRRRSRTRARGSCTPDGVGLPYAGAAGRHGHLPLHRHRRLDAAAPRARRPVRRGARGAPPPAPRAFRGTAASRSTRRATRSSSRSRTPAPPLRRRQKGRSARRGPVRIRVGVHTGEPIVWAEGYAGEDVHRAARICAAAHGGQVVLSERTRSLVDGVAVRELGAHRLKDLSEPQRLFQLGEGRVPAAARRFTRRTCRRSRALIGREREVVEAGELSAGTTARDAHGHRRLGQDEARAPACGGGARGLPGRRLLGSAASRSRRRARRVHDRRDDRRQGGLAEQSVTGGCSCSSTTSSR